MMTSYGMLLLLVGEPAGSTAPRGGVQADPTLAAPSTTLAWSHSRRVKSDSSFSFMGLS
jgi:hypothetical protein